MCDQLVPSYGLLNTVELLESVRYISKATNFTSKWYFNQGQLCTAILKERRRETMRAEQKAGGTHLPDPDIARNRNARLTLEVQKEMARLRTLWPSPLLSQLHQMRDDYMNS
nr:uncharacterized protein LOC113823944 [Penaeus vannamei]